MSLLVIKNLQYNFSVCVCGHHFMYLVSAGKHIQGIRLANGGIFTDYHDCGQQCSHAFTSESHLNKSLRTPSIQKAQQKHFKHFPTFSKTRDSIKPQRR